MTDHRTVDECAEMREALGELPGVVSISVLEWHPSYGRNAIEVCIGPDYDRVPPRVLRTLADGDFGIAEMRRIGSARYIIAV